MNFIRNVKARVPFLDAVHSAEPTKATSAPELHQRWHRGEPAPQMAIAAINWALNRNLRVPQDLKVVGFNGFTFSDLARPPLTTVLSPAYDIGLRGAELMVRRLKQGRFGGRDVVFDVELRARGSD